jgi:hypothetical protein
MAALGATSQRFPVVDARVSIVVSILFGLQTTSWRASDSISSERIESRVAAGPIVTSLSTSWSCSFLAARLAAACSTLALTWSNRAHSAGAAGQVQVLRHVDSWVSSRPCNGHEECEGQAHNQIVRSLDTPPLLNIPSMPSAAQ